MHPLLQSKTGLFTYAAAWLLILLQVVGTLRTSTGLDHRETLLVSGLLTLVMAVVCLTPWYLCRALPLRTTRPLKLVGLLFVATLLMNVLIIDSVRLAMHLASAWLPPDLPIRLRPALPALTPVVFLVYILAIALHYTVLALEQSKRSEVLSREAELRALKAQINPHFLFNSLNSISALALQQPPRAREMCIKLSDFLRISLRLGERLSIPLAEEFVLTRTYLDVEQIRFGSRLRVAQTIANDCGECEVPPLLVQPLVENAIKHGIANLIEGGDVTVTGTREANVVRVRVENPFDPDAPRVDANGLGLANVRNRMHARYGNAARMDIQVINQRYQVTLELPCQGRKS